MAEVTLDFMELFQGGRRATGALWGEARPGGPEYEDWQGHLTMESEDYSLGIYPVLDRRGIANEDIGGRLDHHYERNLGDAWVRWGCSDIDVGFEAGWPQARALQQALDIMHLVSWIEKTKGKGWHVWVFASEWVPAIFMRRALLAAHQMADVPVVEVNPKQVDLTSTKAGLGNYVNLPYFGGRQPGHREVVDFARMAPDALPNEHSMYPVEEFVSAARDGLAPHGTLFEAAKLYVPPAPKRAVVRDSEYEGDLWMATRRLSGLGFVLFRDGPLEGQDRSNKLAQLAHKCAEADLTPEQTMAVLKDADERWGKFFERADCDEQLWRLVENAHG